jgi:hypothetical protein
MLFDLRGRGRRRVVKAVYITLAFLMGGGLVLFGIGSDFSGGLVDAITGSSGGGGEVAERAQEREEQALASARANPEDAAAFAALARARYQRASQGEYFDAENNTFTVEGTAKLREAASAWERHVELAGDAPDPGVAALMVQVYLQLEDASKAATAQEVIAEDRDSAGAYAALATYAYAAGQTRKGDLAADKALELTEDADQRKALRTQLEQAKSQAALQDLQGSRGSAE